MAPAVNRVASCGTLWRTSACVNLAVSAPGPGLGSRKGGDLGARCRLKAYVYTPLTWLSGGSAGFRASTKRVVVVIHQTARLRSPLEVFTRAIQTRKKRFLVLVVQVVKDTGELDPEGTGHKMKLLFSIW